MTKGRFAIITLIVLIVGEVYPPVAWVFAGLIFAAMVGSIIITQYLPIKWRKRFDKKKQDSPW